MYVRVYCLLTCRYGLRADRDQRGVPESHGDAVGKAAAMVWAGFCQVDSCWYERACAVYACSTDTHVVAAADTFQNSKGHSDVSVLARVPSSDDLRPAEELVSLLEKTIASGVCPHGTVGKLGEVGRSGEPLQVDITFGGSPCNKLVGNSCRSGQYTAARDLRRGQDSHLWCYCCIH